MEKIKVNNIEFELLPMGIDETNKKRSLKISSVLNSIEIENVFSDVSKVSLILEDGQETIWLDGVRALSITNHFDGTYTVEISIDAVERQIKDLQAQVLALTLARAE